MGGGGGLNVGTVPRWGRACVREEADGRQQPAVAQVSAWQASLALSPSRAPAYAARTQRGTVPTFSTPPLCAPMMHPQCAPMMHAVPCPPSAFSQAFVRVLCRARARVCLCAAVHGRARARECARAACLLTSLGRQKKRV